VRGVLHSAADPLPPALAVDSSFLAAVINQRDAHHADAWAIYEGMLAAGTTVALCQPIVRIEFNSVFRSWARRLRRSQVERLVEAAQERLRGGQRSLFVHAITPSDAAAKRRFLFRYGHLLVDQVLSTLTVARVRLTNDLLARSTDEAVSASLDSLDAVHAAVARLLGEQLKIPPAIVSFDSDFDRVDDLHVWVR